MHYGIVWKRKDDVSKENSCLIGIGGGTGSGKSTLAKELQRQLSDQGAVLISMDDYYLDQQNIPLKERAKMNYDHPDSLDAKLLAEHLHTLRSGKPILRPTYDFSAHTRSEQTVEIDPVTWIIVEGILTLHYEELLRLFDVTVFVEADADIRFIRRLSRDTKERGRTMDSVILQYLSTVRPMHEQFVETSKVNAEFVVSGETHFEENVVYILQNVAEKYQIDIHLKPVEIEYT